MSTVMHVDMNAFFAAVEQQCNPALRGKPVLICGSPSTRTVVAACSYEAKAYGVKSGMALGEARDLCPHALLVEGNPRKYIDCAIRLFAIFKEFTPNMEIFSIDEAFLDLKGTERIFGSPTQVALKIKKRIREEIGPFITCSVGIGPNKLIAKLASGMQKPDGLVEIKPEEVQGILARLPVTELCGIGERMAGHLGKLGIETVGDLGAFDRDRLVLIFGKNGQLLHDMGEGVMNSDVGLYYEEEVTKSMGHSHTLARDTWVLEEALKTLLRLCEKVGRRLRADGYAGRTVHAYVRFGDMTGAGRQKTIDRFIDDGIEIYDVAVKVIEEILDKRGLEHRARSTEHRTQSREVRVESRGVGTRNLEPGTWNLKPATRNPQPATILSEPIRLIGVSVGGLVKDNSQLRCFEAMKKARSVRESAYRWRFDERGFAFIPQSDVLRRKRLVEAIDEINSKYGEFTVFRSSLLNNVLQPKTHGFLTNTQKAYGRRFGGPRPGVRF